jgi:hypothetical protein
MAEAPRRRTHSGPARPGAFPRGRCGVI